MALKSQGVDLAGLLHPLTGPTWVRRALHGPARVTKSVPKKKKKKKNSLMPDQPQPGRPFQVAAVNVNGLTEATKRRTFFTWAQEQHHGIVLLSETHCTSDSQAQQWVQEGAGLGKPWQGASFW